MVTSPVTRNMNVSYREQFLVVNKNQAGTFTANVYATATNSKMFPWFHNIAKVFDLYTFNYLKFDYIPSCSTLASGNILLGFDFDPADPNESLNYTDYTNWSAKVQGPIRNSLSLTVDLSRSQITQKSRYVSSDPEKFKDRLSSYGMLVVRTGTIENTTECGTIHVTFSAVLTDPQLASMEPEYSPAMNVTLKTNVGTAPLAETTVPVSSNVITTTAVTPQMEKLLVAGLNDAATNIMTNAVTKAFSDGGVAHAVPGAVPMVVMKGSNFNAEYGRDFRVGDWTVGEDNVVWVLGSTYPYDGKTSQWTIEARIPFQCDIGGDELDDVTLEVVLIQGCAVRNTMVVLDPAYTHQFPVAIGTDKVFVLNAIIDIDCTSDLIAFIPYLKFKGNDADTVISDVRIVNDVITSPIGYKYYYVYCIRGPLMR